MMNTGFLVAILSIAFLVAPGAQAAKPQITVIQNNTLRVSYDEGSGMFTLSHISGDSFVVHGTITGVAGTAKKTAVTDKTFGGGQAITVTGADGTEGTVQIFPHLPFALLRRTLKNEGDAAQV